jgi:hypothetical protein
VFSGSYWLRFDAQGFLSRRLQLTKQATERDVYVGLVVLEIGEVTEGPMFPVKPLKKLKPMTVCEALASREQFTGKQVAIVGRIECESDREDHVCLLAEDLCEHPITTDGYAWPNRVLVVDYWENGLPRPSSVRPEIDQDALKRKLSLVRKRTTPGLPREPVPGRWGVAYGVLFTAPRLQKENCGDALGCGGFDGVPIALITLPDTLQALTDNKDPAPQH